MCKRTYFVMREPNQQPDWEETLTWGLGMYWQPVCSFLGSDRRSKQHRIISLGVDLFGNCSNSTR